MSIPSVPISSPVSAVTPISPSRAVQPVSPVASAGALNVDALTQQTQPPRFPWLSRAANQLEQAAAHKQSDFSNAPVLGGHLDVKA